MSASLKVLGGAMFVLVLLAAVWIACGVTAAVYFDVDWRWYYMEPAPMKIMGLLFLIGPFGIWAWRKSMRGK
jgi:hypothetical protein